MAFHPYCLKMKYSDAMNLPKGVSPFLLFESKSAPLSTSISSISCCNKPYHIHLGNGEETELKKAHNTDAIKSKHMACYVKHVFIQKQSTKS